MLLESRGSFTSVRCRPKPTAFRGVHLSGWCRGWNCSSGGHRHMCSDRYGHITRIRNCADWHRSLEQYKHWPVLEYDMYIDVGKLFRELRTARDRLPHNWRKLQRRPDTFSKLRQRHNRCRNRLHSHVCLLLSQLRCH